MGVVDLIMVEDDPMVMAVNDGFINQISGFKIVGTARTGQHAVELVNTMRPRLVILDIYLPDMDGIQVLKEIRRLGVPTDVIMITAAQDVSTVQEVLRLGVVDYIIKPFKFHRIKAALEKYLAYAEKFTARTAIAQEELDSLINAAASGGLKLKEQGMPKGLREITLQQVVNCLEHNQEGLSAEAVAEVVGLARVTARRYLEYLEKIGQVQLLSKYGAVGRPINRYKIRKN